MRHGIYFDTDKVDIEPHRNQRAKPLVAKGVASLAPVTANDSEVDRAKHRRVELVKQQL